MPNTKPPYPAEFKLEAVRLIKENGRKISEIARDLGVTGESIRNWVRQHEIDNGEREGLSTSEREELQRLRRETRILKEEREILADSSAWEINRNDKLKTVDWQFTTDNARIKLKRLYPQFKC